MLHILRHVPLPVAVVTAAIQQPRGHADVEAAGSGYYFRGMTCSTFSSVSMDPPLVSLCLHNGSQFLKMLSRAHGFAVHVLHQGDTTLANNFARPNPNFNLEEFKRAGGECSVVKLAWEEEEESACVREWRQRERAADAAGSDGGAERTEEGGACGPNVGDGLSDVVPVLHDTMAVMACRTFAVHPAGDHVILLGKVISLNSSGGEPLVYMNRGYYSLQRAH